MRRFLLAAMAGAVIILATVAGTGSAFAQDSDAADVVVAMYEAYNAGDADSLLSYYADDAYIDFTYGDIYSGHDQIEEWFLNEMDAGGMIDYEILSADDINVEALTSYTNASSPYTLDATEKFVVEDGLILAHTWLPTDETVDLLTDAQQSEEPSALVGKYGILGDGAFFSPDETGGEAELRANFIGIIDADGSGYAQGARVLNGSNQYRDEIYGSYTDLGDGSLNFQWEAYQTGEDAMNAREAWDCFIQADGEAFQCIVTGYVANPESDEPLQLRVIATIDGQRID